MGMCCWLGAQARKCPPGLRFKDRLMFCGRCGSTKHGSDQCPSHRHGRTVRDGAPPLSPVLAECLICRSPGHFFCEAHRATAAAAAEDDKGEEEDPQADKKKEHGSAKRKKKRRKLEEQREKERGQQQVEHRRKHPVFCLNCGSKGHVGRDCRSAAQPHTTYHSGGGGGYGCSFGGGGRGSGRFGSNAGSNFSRGRSGGHDDRPAFSRVVWRDGADPNGSSHRQHPQHPHGSHKRFGSSSSSKREEFDGGHRQPSVTISVGSRDGKKRTVSSSRGSNKGSRKGSRHLDEAPRKRARR